MSRGDSGSELWMQWDWYAKRLVLADVLKRFVADGVWWAEAEGGMLVLADVCKEIVAGTAVPARGFYSGSMETDVELAMIAVLVHAPRGLSPAPRRDPNWSQRTWESSGRPFRGGCYCRQQIEMLILLVAEGYRKILLVLAQVSTIPACRVDGINSKQLIKQRTSWGLRTDSI